MDHGELGRKLFEIRLQRGLSQRKLAQGSEDLTATGVSRVERGERWPNLRTLEALSKTLRVAFVIDPNGTRIVALAPGWNKKEEST